KSSRPSDTFVITIGDTFSLLILLQEILLALGVKPPSGKNSKYSCLKYIIARLLEIKEEGGKPMIILDEAENSKLPMLKAYKQLYDHVHEKCALVLIGTDQLLFAIEKKSLTTSIPQLRRRLKAGTKLISPLNKARDFRPFFSLYVPDEP